MILADASIWIDHFRSEVLPFRALLDTRQIVIHPFVVGELSLGSLRNRSTVLADLRDLIFVRAASDDDVDEMIERQRLWGRGIGYVDAHLLASTMVNDDCFLLTRDKRLAEVAHEAGVLAHMIH